MSEEKDRKKCPYCAEEILAVATICKHCRSRLDGGSSAPVAAGQRKEVLGVISIGIPVFAAFLMIFWIGNMNLLQGPGSKLMFVGLFTIISTSALIAVEASNVGAGADGDLKANGKKFEGPVIWLICCLLLWIVGYPYWFFRRARYGLQNMGVISLFSAFLFWGALAYMNSAIENAKQDAWRGVEDFQRELQKEFDSIYY
jgi:hypothetical protein